ncbi:MAG: carbohydrate binding family 9 domain-containing protein [Candidatus Aminicenantes bacterium]|nr:MAG: carbohydrate binding family 9 domain-containing protein [Candidatus Aminicenantes bacterium]
MIHPKARTPIAEAQVYQISQQEQIKVDGLLTEPVWQSASPIGPLIMVEPDEGVPPSMETEVRIVVDSRSIYFGIMCFDSDPDKIVSYTMQRDAQLRGEDHVKIVLDTFLNGRTGYIFAINPNGARYDGLIEREGEGENEQWDGIWEAEARRFEQGWSAEIFIPIKTIRFATGLTQWGFNVERRIQRFQETDRWASPNRNFKVTNVSTAGQLTSLPAFQQGKGLTVRPYAMGNRIQNSTEEAVAHNFEPGLDVMKNFGGNVTGLLSVNTDFAETEVDTRRINLTRFPLFFPEKRTFFLEGSDIYEFGLGMSFHHSRDLVPFFSRRIGLEEGETVPIDVAGKATGSTGGFSFGVLNALMRPVEGLSPRTNLFAARGFQNIWAESRLGFLITAGDPLGRSNSWQAGIDFVYKTSHFQGDKNFLIGIWGLINNREDVGNDRTAFGVAIDYPNDLWDISFNFKRIGEDYDPSMGFVPWKGIYKANFNLNFKPRPNWSWVRQMMHEFFTQAVWDLDGKIYQWRIFTAPLNWRLESGDRIEFNIVPYYERIPEDFEIAEGVFVNAGKYNWWRYRLEFQSASKRRVTTKISWWFGTLYDGTMDQLQVELEWRPSHRLNLGFQGERSWGKMPAGEVDIQLGRARIDLFLTPNFQILSFLQYDNITKSLGLNTRLRFTYRSLLDIFLVYNRNWLDTQGRFLSELNQFFVKVQYSWRW